MSEYQGEAPPSPKLHTRSGPSLVWLIPLATLLIGGWLVFKTVTEKGPVITLAFKTADGIEAGSTRVKYKKVDVGVVQSLRFSKDYSQVILTVQMNKNAGRLLRRGTRFWVVRPRLSLREVSGLGTLLSGAYIEVDPGQGVRQRHFVGMETPPIMTTEDDGEKVLLMSPRLGSLGIGSPVYYQGIHAGEIMGYELGDDLNSVLIHAFIKSPYDDLVKGNSRFWTVSGLDVTMDADGVRIHTESLESLMFGGIAFETPTTLEPVNDDVSGLVYSLYPSYDSIIETNYTRKLQFVLFFEGSVRGLNVDAPVEFKGIKVGSVRDVRLEFHTEETSFRIPVLVEIEPERIVQKGKDTGESTGDVVKTLVERGLRARLQTGSLLTGQLFIELLMAPDTEVSYVDADVDIPQLPTIPGQLDELTNSVKGFLARLEKVELDRIAAELQGTLEGANRLINDPKLASAVGHLDHTLAGAERIVNDADVERVIDNLADSLHSLKGVLASLDKRSEPLSENLVSALHSLDQTLLKAKETMTLADGVLQPDSQLHYRVIQMVDELAETARSIRAFMNLLERTPDSLIFGKEAPR